MLNALSIVVSSSGMDFDKMVICMTVKQLKEALLKFDDNLLVVITTECGHSPLTGISQGVNEADGCLFLDDYEEDEVLA